MDYTENTSGEWLTQKEHVRQADYTEHVRRADYMERTCHRENGKAWEWEMDTDKERGA